MKIITILLALIAFLSCSSANKNEGHDTDPPEEVFQLKDYYSVNAALDRQVESVMETLTTRQRVAQMIIQAAGRLGKPDKEIDALIKSHSIGGVLLLNGTVEGFKQKVHHFDSMAQSAGLLPLVYSADAEPSLIYRKIEGSTPVPKTIELKTKEDNREAAQKISKDLKEIGILYNYAPVLDVSPDNVAIKNRSYGSDPDSVVRLARAFVNEMQAQGVAATIKHFPGHGLVKGDTHSQLVFIDGEMMEVALYDPFIKEGVISVMVGHIAVKNNTEFSTDGLPASCSKVIVTDLLRKKMGFNGIIITDAMNMGALKIFPNADFLAIEAGNDIVLMPGDPEMLVDQVISKMEKDAEFAVQIEASIRRIIRMKICLGIL